MKTKFLNTIKLVLIAAVLSVGVSYVYVSAFTQPTAAPGTSASNVATPVHTGSTQEKKGGIWSKKVLASPISMFKKSIFLPGKNSSLRIGSDDAAGTQNFTKGSAGAISQSLNTAIFGDDNTVPLVIDLHGRTKPQDAIEFKNTMCPVVTRFTNDKAAAFEFKQGTNNANIIARQVQLTGGDPDANDVLLGDASGNARWAKATVVNGAVVFSSGVSPVIEGQTCQVPDNSWSVGSWGPCELNDGNPSLPASTVGTYQQIREVVCKDQNGNTVPDSQCPQPKPDINQPCSAPVPNGCYAYEIKTNCLGNVGGLGVVIPPGCTKTSTVGQTSCSTQNQGQEIYRIQCTSPIADTVGVGLPNDLPDGPIHFTNSNPIYCPVSPDAIKLWYCHLQGGNWVDQTAQYSFEGSCGSENYQAGYYKSNTYICSKTKPTGSTCLSPTQSSSGNYTPIVQGCSTAAECLVN